MPLSTEKKNLGIHQSIVLRTLKLACTSTVRSTYPLMDPCRRRRRPSHRPSQHPCSCGSAVSGIQGSLPDTWINHYIETVVRRHHQRQRSAAHVSIKKKKLKKKNGQHCTETMLLRIVCGLDGVAGWRADNLSSIAEFRKLERVGERGGYVCNTYLRVAPFFFW